MKQTVLKVGEYTLNVSAKTITLAPPYNTIDVAQVISIFDITSKNSIYHVESIASSRSISIVNGVITYTKDLSNEADSDELRIVIETELDFTDLDQVVFENVILPAGVGQLLISGWIPIEGHDKVNLFLASTVSILWNVEFTDNPTNNADGFENCNNTGTVVTYTTVGKADPIVPGKYRIPITDIKASAMRIIAKNTSATLGDIPYCGVK